MDELETSLEQKRSYIKSHKLAQHPTTYKHHRHSDPVVLDSYEWVLLLKNGNIAQYKPLNSILKSVAKTFNFKEKPTTKDLLALPKTNALKPLAFSYGDTRRNAFRCANME
ncbi:hypothetical protein HpKG88_10760 [Helicobacter pylori]